MLTEIIEFSHKIKEDTKATQGKMKQTIQGANSEGKETGTQINDLEQKEEINIQLEQNQEFKKRRRSLGTSRTTLMFPLLNHSGARRRR